MLQVIFDLVLSYVKNDTSDTTCYCIVGCFVDLLWINPHGFKRVLNIKIGAAEEKKRKSAAVQVFIMFICTKQLYVILSLTL